MNTRKLLERVTDCMLELGWQLANIHSNRNLSIYSEWERGSKRLMIRIATHKHGVRWDGNGISMYPGSVVNTINKLRELVKRTEDESLQGKGAN